MSGGGRGERKVALVTGGGSGIGRGIALALGRRGVDVALAGRRLDLLEAVAAEVSALGVRALPLQVDLAGDAARGELVSRVLGELGRLDILANNAAVMSRGTLLSKSPEQVRAAVATNLLAPIELTRHALPELARRKGAVVLVASTVSRVPLPYASLYSATKAGLWGFGEALRFELEPLGVRLMLVYPPGTDTDMVRGMAEAMGVSGVPLTSAEKVGERIVKSLASGKQELHMGPEDLLLPLLYRISPRLVRALYRSQRALFERMMGG
ncbi:MAG TPA: SDR family NAD(P)-dependent oxidoreductase [Chloroflexia bacterium]|nr:SDR family NAD(P)-dependent oxidoreductase [Chloroflexia bacterium]